MYDLINDAPFPKDIGDRVLTNEFNSAWHGQDTNVIAHREELRAQLSMAEQASDANKLAVRVVRNATRLIRSVELAGDIVRRIIEEAEAILRSRPQRMLEG